MKVEIHCDPHIVKIIKKNNIALFPLNTSGEKQPEQCNSPE